MSKRSKNRKAYYKQYADANKEWRRRIVLGGYYRRTFWPHLTSEQAYEMKAELCRKHNNRCDICKNESSCDSLRVDHDHATGLIRGILCNKCNQGIGYFDECQDRLQQAIVYLEYNKAQKLKG